MKLYYSPGACSMSPHIVLNEGSFQYTVEKVDLKNDSYSGGKYSKVNPKGYVPALELDNGELLTEGVAIVQYLGEKKPETKLFPAAGTMERARCVEWLTYIATELHKNFGPLFFPGSTESDKASAKEKLAKRIGYLDSQLKGRDFLVGTSFTVADAYAFTVLGWSGHVGFDLKPFANVGPYLERIGKRPKVVETMKQEGLI